MIRARVDEIPWDGGWAPLLGPWPLVRRLDGRSVPRDPNRPPVHVREGDGALALPVRHKQRWLWTMVAAEDAWAIPFNWFLHTNEYAVTNIRDRIRLLHRLVVWCQRERRTDVHAYWMSGALVVDHDDRNRLNNLRSNLNLTDSTGNNLNTSARRPGSSVPGVTWDQEHQRWYAKLKYEGKTVHVGRFRAERQAERAIERARAQLQRQHERKLRSEVAAATAVDEPPF